MKKSLLTLAIIFIGLFVAAQSNTTLKIVLYPIQIIELDNTIENDDLETLHDANLNTFSTSGFEVNIILTDEDDYSFNIDINSHLHEDLVNDKKKVGEMDNNNIIANQELMSNPENMSTNKFLENRMALNTIPDLIYSIEAL